MMKWQRRIISGFVGLVMVVQGITCAAEPSGTSWKYLPERLRPFWQGDAVQGESVLFIKDSVTGEAKASLFFPARQVLAVRNSAGDITYQEGRDYRWQPGSRAIVLPPGSRITFHMPQDLRRPAKSQRFQLTHRDGNGEILFGGKLEYHNMQTCITYRHAPDLWTAQVPSFDAKVLPRTLKKLHDGRPLSLVVLGDSISTGCNASGWADEAPFQPAYPGLLKTHLESHYHIKVDLTNLSVGGKTSAWGVTVTDKVVQARPDLVILAFGMNDAAGVSAKVFQANTKAMITKIRKSLPDCEFILVATMLGNPDWITLKQPLFVEYRDALAELCTPGIALADVTSIWRELLTRKQYWDMTGNGVNHPNDFGHRIYAEVISALLIAPESCDTPDALSEQFADPPLSVRPWAYWWWLNANVTKQSITRDLEAMKTVGLGGFLLFDVTSYGHELVPPPKRTTPFMSPRWRRLVHHATVEADRLGLQMSVNLSTSGGSLQAAWDMGPDAPKQLVWRSADVAGPVKVQWQLEQPTTHGFHPVAVLAVQLDPVDRTDEARSKRPVQATGFTGDWSPVSSDLKRRGALTQLNKSTAASKVVELTSKLDSRGRLVWNVPKGNWTLLQFAWQLIPERGHDVDILNTECVKSHWRQMGNVILQDAGPLVGRTLGHFYNVSWEGTSPSWTPGFEQAFRKYRGYDIRKYLPILAGIVVENLDVSRRFQRDFCLTLSDCFLHNCYETYTELCHRAGIKWHSESGGPWRDYPLLKYADQLQFWGRNDMPQGEFWIGDKIRSNVRRTAMAAHLYGKRLVSVEAFTHMRRHWSSYPALLKPLADQTFCDGANQFVWHTFSASPVEFGKPGIVYFAGTHLNPNVTWWPMARPFVDYLARCQTLLQRGRFIADVCCYTTTHNQQNWGRDKQWGDDPLLAMPQGYVYDLLDTETLLNRLEVDNGQLVLPGGMHYQILVVDLKTDVVPPNVLRKINQLAEAGATVVLGARRPSRSPGLKDYPNADQETRRLAASLWGAKSEKSRNRTVGRGRIISGTKLSVILKEESVLPDCDTSWDYIHRRSERADIYFLAGSGQMECTFRVSDKLPERWDPRTGVVTELPVFHSTKDGRMAVTLDLPENGSTFVVFRKPIERSHLVSTSGPRGGLEVLQEPPSDSHVRIWKAGHYTLTPSRGAPWNIQADRLPAAVSVNGPWQVRFDPAWGGPESIMFDRLAPWNEHSLAGIKYYSGKATYNAAVQITAKQASSPARLSLGQVMCIARVRINGHDKGVVWTAPWSVDVTGDLKPGKNELEIDVINTWVNRLIGDAALPAERRRTKTIVRLETGKRKLRVFQSFGSTDSLMPSGLIGPVRLEFGKAVHH